MTRGEQQSGLKTFPERSTGRAGSGVVVFALASLATFLVAAAGLLATLLVVRLVEHDEPPPPSATRPPLSAPAPAPAPLAIPSMPAALPPPAPPRPTLPAHCPTNGSLVIDGEQGAFSQPVITADMNCQITIRGSRLSGPQVVVAGQNVKVLVESSTLEATGVALEGGLNFEAEIFGNSTVTGSFAGLKAGTNAKLRLTGSRIAGGRVAVMVETNAQISAIDSTIEVAAAGAGPSSPPGAAPAAMQAGVLAGNNARLTLTRSRVLSPHTALWTSLNGEIDAEGSAIEGGEVAIKAEGNLTAALRSTTTAGRVEDGHGSTVESH